MGKDVREDAAEVYAYKGEGKIYDSFSGSNMNRWIGLGRPWSE